MGKKDKSKKVDGASGAASSNTNGHPVASTSGTAKPAKLHSVASSVATTSKQSASAKSEIDDIFAGKKKALPTSTINELNPSTSNPSENESSKKGKRKARDAVDESIETTTSNTNAFKSSSNAPSGLDVKGKGKSAVKDTNASSKAQTPQVTVVDASSIPGLATSSTSKKRRKSDKTSENATSSNATVDTASKEEDELFRDSRGTSRRKTDDGLPIYDIKELNIGLGGDTELCPFDCDCCF